MKGERERERERERREGKRREAKCHLHRSLISMYIFFVLLGLQAAKITVDASDALRPAVTVSNSFECQANFGEVGTLYENERGEKARREIMKS